MALFSRTFRSSIEDNKSERKILRGQKHRYEIVPPTEDYFQCLKVQPGAAFFRALLDCNYPINSLSLNIPTILINMGVNVMIKTGYSFVHRIDKRGKLKIKKNVKVDHFIKKLTKRGDKLYVDQPLVCIQEISEVTPWDENEVKYAERELEAYRK